MSNLLMRLSERALGKLPMVKPLPRRGPAASSMTEDFAAIDMTAEEIINSHRNSRDRPEPVEFPASLSRADNLDTSPSARTTSPTPTHAAPPTLSEVIQNIYRSDPPQTTPHEASPAEPAAEVRRVPVHPRPAQEENSTQPPPTLPQPTRMANLPASESPSTTADHARDERKPDQRNPTAHHRSRTEERSPDVQVNIGRIELHAAPPPAVVRAAPPARPTLSLEDYLQARRGGRA